VDAEDVLRTLGTRVRGLREGHGWSQEDLARSCGRHFTYIGRIERGEQNVTVAVLHDIATALGVQIADLLIEAHPLLASWKVSSSDVVEALAHGFRAQVDVKGKLAEWLLFKELTRLQDTGEIQELEWLDADDMPDFVIKTRGRRVTVQCKNARSPTANMNPGAPIKVELQKTRNARDGSNTRGYKTDQFSILSVCLFNRTRNWDFLHIPVRQLATRAEDPTYLAIMQTVPAEPSPPWRGSILEAIEDLE